MIHKVKSVVGKWDAQAQVIGKDIRRCRLKIHVYPAVAPSLATTQIEEAWFSVNFVYDRGVSHFVTHQLGMLLGDYLPQFLFRHFFQSVIVVHQVSGTGLHKHACLGRYL